MKNLWPIALLFSLLAVPLSAQTSETIQDSGNAFLRLCSAIDTVVSKNDVGHLSTNQALDLMNCTGYVGGFTDGVLVGWAFVQVSQTKQNSPLPFCEPDTIETGQKIRIVLRYIRDDPEEAHEKTALLIMKALAKAYPCPSK